MEDLFAGSSLEPLTPERGGFICKCNICKADGNSKVVSMWYKPGLHDLSCRMCAVYQSYYGSAGYMKHKQVQDEILGIINRGTELRDALSSHNVLQFNKKTTTRDGYLLDVSFFDDDSGIYDYPSAAFMHTLTLNNEDARCAGVIGVSANRFMKSGYIKSDYKDFVMYCKHCESYFRIDKPLERSKNFVCPLCTDARKMLARNKDSNLQRTNATKQRKNSEKEFGVVTTSANAVTETVKKNAQALVDLGEDLIFGGVNRQKSSRYEYTLICKRCGFPNTVLYKTRKSDGSIATDVTCPYCKNGVPPHRTGKFNISHIGEVYNHLEVVEQDRESMTCTLECVICHKRQSMVPIYEAIELRNRYCTCQPLEATTKSKGTRGSIITDFCPFSFECEHKDCIYQSGVEMISATVEDILKDKVRCPFNPELNLSQSLLDTMNGEDIGTTFRHKASILDRTFGKGIKTKSSANRKLRQEVLPLFVATDDKEYFRCMCMTCNKMLTLSSDEISTFEHGELCDDTRQTFIKDIDLKKLKLR